MKALIPAALVSFASNPAMHLAALDLKLICCLERFAAMDYFLASTKEEPVGQSMNPLQFPVGEQTHHRFEALALRQVAFQDADLKQHFPRNRRSRRASKRAKPLHQEDRDHRIEKRSAHSMVR